MDKTELQLNDCERRELHILIIGAIALRARFRNRLKSNGIDIDSGDSNELYDAINEGYAALMQAYEINNHKIDAQ